MAEVYDSREISWGKQLVQGVGYLPCLYWLVYREVRTRYRNALLGFAWALIQPLATVLVIAGIFQQAAGITIPNQEYSLFLGSAVVPWLYFSKATSSAVQSFLSYDDVVKYNFFPRVFVPLTFVLAHTVDLFVGIVIVGIWSLWAGHGISAQGAATIVLSTVWLITFSMIVAIILAPIQVRIRDIAYATAFALQGLFFASPILYSGKHVTGIWKQVLDLNPLTGILELFRAGFLGIPANTESLQGGALVTALLLLLAVGLFSRMGRNVGDYL